MPKDKHGTQVSDGDMLRFNDGTIAQVFRMVEHFILKIIIMYAH